MYGQERAQQPVREQGQEPSFNEMLKFIAYEGAKELREDFEELYGMYKNAFKLMFTNPSLFVELVKNDFKEDPVMATASLMPFGGVLKDTLVDLGRAVKEYWQKENPTLKDKEELAKNVRRALIVSLVSLTPVLGASIMKKTSSKAARILEHFSSQEINKLMTSPVSGQFLEAVSLLEKAVEKGGKLPKEESKRLKDLMKEIAEHEPEAAKKLAKAYGHAKIPSLKEITAEKPPGGLFEKMSDSMMKTVETIVNAMDLGKLKDAVLFVGENKELAIVFEVIDKEGRPQKYIIGTGKIANKTNLIDITTGSRLGIGEEVPLPKELQGPQKMYKLEVLSEKGGRKTMVR